MSESSPPTSTTPLVPKDAAVALGVKPAMLRRYAAAFEQVHGPLPRDERGARVYPRDVIDRLQAVRAYVQSNESTSIADALRDAPMSSHPESSTHDIDVHADDVDVRALLQRLLLLIESGTYRQESASPAIPANVNVVELQQTVIDLERRNRALVNEIESLRAERDTKAKPLTLWQRIFGRS